MKLQLLSPESLGLTEKETTRILGPQTFTEQLQNAGSLLTMNQTSRLVWLGSGSKNEV